MIIPCRFLVAPAEERNQSQQSRRLQDNPSFAPGAITFF